MKLCYFIYAVFGILTLRGQNLVPNYSFESNTGCPTNGSQVNLVTSWTSPINNDADYYHTCSPNSGLSVPHAGSGYQLAKTGSAFVGFYTYNYSGNNYREYVRANLTTTLSPSSLYKVRFYLSTMVAGLYATNNIGLNFSSSSVNTTTVGDVINLPMQIYKFTNPIISDTLNWTEVVGIYQATGGEQVITIGNFLDDYNTDTLALGNIIYPGSYYYLDDISVIPISAPDWQYRDTTITLGDSVLIGPAITGLNVDWYSMSNAFIKNDPGIYVKPTVTTSYKAIEIFNSAVYNHTVTVTVLTTGMKDQQKLDAISIYPNPGNGTFTTKKMDGFDNVIATVYALNGKQLIEIVLSGTEQTINLNDLAEGIYVLELRDKKQNFATYKKLVIQK